MSADRKSIGQYYPPGQACVYVLYDSDDEFGFRIDYDGTFTLGDVVEVEGQHPLYRLTVPSGMTFQTTAESVAVVQETGLEVSLPDAIRDSLAAARP